MGGGRVGGGGGGGGWGEGGRAGGAARPERAPGPGFRRPTAAPLRLQPGGPVESCPRPGPGSPTTDRNTAGRVGHTRPTHWAAGRHTRRSWAAFSMLACAPAARFATPSAARPGSARPDQPVTVTTAPMWRRLGRPGKRNLQPTHRHGRGFKFYATDSEEPAFTHSMFSAESENRDGEGTASVTRTASDVGAQGLTSSCRELSSAVRAASSCPCCYTTVCVPRRGLR